jgi:hypothetical protein
MAQNGSYFESEPEVPLLSASASEGDCTERLRAYDRHERYSAADSNDLTVRETIELYFPSTSLPHAGLVLGFRQTLLSTFIFYQTLAYMGGSAGTMVAAVESNPSAFLGRWQEPGSLLGGIEVQVLEKDGSWTTVDDIRETGPIARNMIVVPLPPGVNTGHLRLRLTRGMWRIDYTALAETTPATDTVRVRPCRMSSGGAEDTTALASLLDPKCAVITLPGDAYDIEYNLPTDFRMRDLFLESRGYYMEWMREQWLEEENAGKIMQLAMDPRQFLKDEAKRFKAYEPTMEETFWNSAYVRSAK